MIIFAKIWKSIHCSGFITQNVHPADIVVKASSTVISIFARRGSAHLQVSRFRYSPARKFRKTHTDRKRQLIAALKSGTPTQTRAKGKSFHFAESRKESHCKTRLELATPTLTSNVDSLSFWSKVVLYQLSYFRICFTNSAHFWLRSLRERKLSLSPVRKFHKTYINKKRQLIAVLKSGKRGSNSRPQHWQAMLHPYLFEARFALPT